MRKATILFNPNSGRRGRDAELNHAIDIIQSAGIHTDLVICHSSPEASDKARVAAEAGSEIVFACGGDGTISDVIQGLVGTGAALAVLPFGTANALAHDLSLPLHPGAAAQAAIEGRVRRIPLGLVEYMDLNGKRAARYFTVAAGVGVDAHLFYALTAELKSRSGMVGYYIKAWHLWATHKMRRFEVEYLTHDGARKHALLTELLAVRIRYFGNILRELVPEASLERNDLRAVMCRTASRHAYLRYVAGVLLGRRWEITGIDLVSCSEIVCRLPKKSDGSDSNGSSVESAIEDRVYVEADGELIGRLPARMTMVPDALSLVVPSTSVEQKSTVQRSSAQESAVP
jgi:diacylglycerol kinase family enzyme